MIRLRQIKKDAYSNQPSAILDPLFLDTTDDDIHNFKKHKLIKTSKNMLSFVQRILFENKLKQVYRKLDTLCYHTDEELIEKQNTGVVAHEWHPLKEQEWFIDNIRQKISDFSAQDIWLLMLYHEQREKYAKYILQTHDLDHLEIFFQNYFVPALSKRHLREVFLLIFEENKAERDSYLQKFFNCLHYKQGKYLLEALMQGGVKNKALNGYCKCMLTHMRNTQISQAVCLFPEELEAEALQKLYPCEVLAIVESQTDEHKRKELTLKILKGCRSWWSSFSQEEINKTLSLLSSK